MIQNHQRLFGVDILLNSNLVQRGPDETVKRTWRERLFTRPWHPMQKTKTVATYVPSEQMYNVAGTLIMHPAIWERVKKAVEELHQ